MEIAEIFPERHNFDELEEAKKLRIAFYDIVITFRNRKLEIDNSAHYRLALTPTQARNVRNGFYNNDDSLYLARQLSSYNNINRNIGMATITGGENFGRRDFVNGLIWHLTHPQLPIQIPRNWAGELEIRLEKA